MVQTFLSGNINTFIKFNVKQLVGFFLKSISLNLYKCQVYDKHAVNSTKV